MILKRGNVTHSIVIPNDSTSAELNAAKELQHYCECIGLGYLPINRVREFSGNALPIYVGWSDMAKEITKLSPEEMALDESVICVTADGRAVFAGHPTRGALYAVYRFLEKYCDIRWWSVNEETTHLVTELAVPEMFDRFVPSFAVRQSDGAQFVGDKGATKTVAYYNARLGKNASNVTGDLGGVEIDKVLCRNSHTSERFVPDEAFFKSHPTYYGADEAFAGSKPEYFALRDGRRLSASEGQPCQTNPETVQVAAENILKLLRRKNQQYDVVWLTQNDNTNYCECPNCLKAIERLGSRTDLNIQFVNQVAEIVNREYPDIAIETFAYQFTLMPPKTVRPSEHVHIRVCLIEADAGHPLTHPNNAQYYEALKGWCAISQNVNIWHYITNFTNMGYIHPFARTMAADIRLFKELGIKDVYSEDCAECGQFSWLSIFRGSLNAHLLMDTDMDDDAFAEDFFRGYYGKAGDSLLAMFRLYEKTAAESSAMITCYQMDTSHWLPLDVLDQGEKLLEEAERVTPRESEYARRVALVRLNQDWTRLWRHENTVMCKLDNAQPQAAEMVAALRNGIVERASSVPRTPGWYGFWTRHGHYTPERHVALLDGYMAPEAEHVGLPVELADTPSEDLIIIPFERYDSYPSNLKTIPDYKSPVNQTVRLRLFNDFIFLRIDLPALANADEWEIFAEMRLPDAESDAKGTIAMAGVYDYGTNWESLTKFLIAAEQLTASEYRLVSLGSTDFHRDGQIYFRGGGSSAPHEILLGRTFLRRKNK
ncbi:MAG: DUF4838 domain-containing protein [Lentisphaeria bacterium]|nr:DUF4838 domain-containing protein [Lentisphaeria bacterium]